MDEMEELDHIRVCKTSGALVRGHVYLLSS